MTSLVDIEGVAKRFGDVQALAGIDLALRPREFVSLVGASGCGKSTLLSILAGLEPFDAGRVRVDGRDIAGPGLDRGVVFQSYTLLPWLTARGNVEFALRAAGHRGRAMRETAERFLALVRLDRFADSYPGQLSGGMKQRVAIARALSYAPRVLLMDEPFGALDALTRARMQALLIRVWEEHRLTVLFVTHDVEEAVLLSDRVVTMGLRPGRIRTVFDVDLARPRTPDTRADPRCLALQRAILDEIRDDLRDDLPDDLPDDLGD